MKKIFLPILGLSIIASNASTVWAEDTTFIAKASFDIFEISTESEDKNKSFDSDGTQIGGTLSAGFAGNFFFDNTPSQLLVDFSRRSGDFSSYVVGPTGVGGTFDVDRDDTELKVTYQYLGELLQPVIGVGYYNIEIDNDASRHSSFGNSSQDHDLFMIGGGLGLKLGSLGPVSFNTKAEIYYLIGEGTEEYPSGRSPHDADVDGFMTKITAQAVYPLSHLSEDLANGGLFIEPGYQYQTIDVDFKNNDGVYDDEWTYSGFYLRAGVYFLF